MTGGAIYFGAKAASAHSERWRILLILNFFIFTAAIAVTLYLITLTGQGGSCLQRLQLLLGVGSWILSTPLLLSVLAYLKNLPIYSRRTFRC